MSTVAGRARSSRDGVIVRLIARWPSSWPLALGPPFISRRLASLYEVHARGATATMNHRATAWPGLDRKPSRIGCRCSGRDRRTMRVPAILFPSYVKTGATERFPWEIIWRRKILFCLFVLFVGRRMMINARCRSFEPILTTCAGNWLYTIIRRFHFSFEHADGNY